MSEIRIVVRRISAQHIRGTAGVMVFDFDDICRGKRPVREIPLAHSPQGESYLAKRALHPISGNPWLCVRISERLGGLSFENWKRLADKGEVEIYGLEEARTPKEPDSA